MRPSVKSRLIIFDLGGVAFRHSFDFALEYWAKKSNSVFSSIKKKFFHDHIYALHEVDKISIEEYKNHVCDTLGIALSIEDFIIGWNSIFLEEIQGVSETIESISKKFSVVALSNTNQTHCQYMKIKYSSILSKFNKVYYSHEILERKPNPGAYERVMTDFHVSSSETVFLDDLVENIAGASKLGIQTIHVTDYSSMISGLKSLEVLD